MSRLSDLYSAIETLRKEGLSTTELEESISQAEEEIIKKELLPIVKNKIEPVLQQVERELVLVVDYKPNEPISVHLSRKINFTEMIPDAKEILPDPQVEHKDRQGVQKSKMSPATRIKITYADGKVLQEKSAAETLKKFVLEVGIEKVRAVGLKTNKVLLVSNTLDKKYKSSQHSLGKGWYLMTCSNTMTKKREIEKIAETYGIQLKVEVV